MKHVLAALFASALLSAPSIADQRAAASAWLSEHAVPIASADPEATDRDLAPVEAMVGAARIVGAGEATHGTREFFQLKDRLFRRLVANADFTGFAIEANFADAEAVNDYVHGGPGDPQTLIGAMGFWTWDTEEVLALVTWMRTWNATHQRKVSFYGFDIQFAPTNLAIALRYLESAGADTKTWRTLFAPYLATAKTISAGYKATNSYTPAQMAALRQGSAALFSAVDARRDAPDVKTNPDGFGRARAAALAGAWYFVMQSKPVDWQFTAFRNEYDVRDRAMADLIEAALAREGPNGKLFVWAHNGHIAKVTPEKDARMTMGRYLAEDGQPYLALGMTFGEGAFQAFPTSAATPAGRKPSLLEMHMGPASDDAPEQVLRRGSGPIWIADLRKLEKGTAAQAWFSTPQPVRWAGSDYSVEQTADHPPVDLRASYDLLLYVDRTTRARPLAATRRRYGIVKNW